jgi:hypothetical protein
MISAETIWAWAADVILLVHVAFVVFIVGGLLLIWIGGWQKWRVVRNRCFRLWHVGAMALVLVQTLIGVICPLTVWEAALRERAGQPAYGDATFVQYWLQRLLFWELPVSVFLVLYAGIMIAIVAAWWWVRPQAAAR